MKNRLFFSLFSLFLTVTASMPALAGDLVVTRYFSGLWEQPQHESQGLVLQIIDQTEIPTVVLATLGVLAACARVLEAENIPDFDVILATFAYPHGAVAGRLARRTGDHRR